MARPGIGRLVTLYIVLVSALAYAVFAGFLLARALTGQDDARNAGRIVRGLILLVVAGFALVAIVRTHGSRAAVASTTPAPAQADLGPRPSTGTMTSSADEPGDFADAGRHPPRCLLVVGARRPGDGLKRLYTRPSRLHPKAHAMDDITTVRSPAGDAVAGLVVGQASFDEQPPTMRRIDPDRLERAFETAAKRFSQAGRRDAPRLHLAYVWEH